MNFLCQHVGLRGRARKTSLHHLLPASWIQRVDEAVMMCGHWTFWSPGVKTTLYQGKPWHPHMKCISHWQMDANTCSIMFIFSLLLSSIVFYCMLLFAIVISSQSHHLGHLGFKIPRMKETSKAPERTNQTLGSNTVPFPHGQCSWIGG